MKKRLVVCLLLLAFALSSCSIRLDQGSTSTALPAASVAPVEKGTKIPVAWADLQLTGKLIYIGQSDTTDSVFMTIQMLNLETGEVSTIFQAPDNALIYALTLSPDRRKLYVTNLGMFEYQAVPGADRGSTSNNQLLASISNLMDIPATSFGTGYPGTLAGLA